MTTRHGRKGARPISLQQSMHLVLRSSLAKGHHSLKSPRNSSYIQKTVQKFAHKNGIQVLSLANVGNHLHFHVRITKRIGYLRFIRAVTAAIAMHVMEKNRWSEEKTSSEGATRSQTRQRTQNSASLPSTKTKFWDYRPFTKIVESYVHFLKMKDYLEINQLEGLGLRRDFAQLILIRRPRLC